MFIPETPQVLLDYMEKFQKIEYDNHEEKFIYEDRVISLRKKTGIDYVFNTVLEKIPSFLNREDIAINLSSDILQVYINNNKAYFFEADFGMYLETIDVFRELRTNWEIKNILPDLEDIIRKIVQEEIKKIIKN